MREDSCLPRVILYLGLALGQAFAAANTAKSLAAKTPATKSSAASGINAKSFKINYLSRDFVYLKAGRKEGIENGDTLVIRRNENPVAVLVVEFSADYSSSCKIASQKGNIVLGDVATPKSKAVPVSTGEMEKDTLVSRTRELPRIHVQGDVGRAFARTRGNIAYQMYLEKGFAGDKLQMVRQNARMNIRMSELPGNYSIRLDMNATQRNNLFSESSGNRNWDNRVNQASFGYDNRGGKLSYEVGRVIPQKISSIGYIDGGAFLYKATESQYIGAFGGNIPKMLYYETPISIQKYGGFYGLDFNAGRHVRLENTVGFGGEYDGAVISREFINLRNNFSLFSNFSLSQVSEIEVNRGWRREKADADYSISSMYVNGNWKASKTLSFGIQYDTRKNYYRLNTRSLADSLFDDATTMGLKENVYLRFLPTASLYFGLGHTQFNNNGKAPINYNLGLNVDNFILKRLYLNTYYTGFKSDMNNGYNGSMNFRKSFLNGNDFSIGYGRYQYDYNSGQASTLKSDWSRVGGTVQLILKTYVTADYEYRWGEADNGHRGFVELGYWL